MSGQDSHNQGITNETQEKIVFSLKLIAEQKFDEAKNVLESLIPSSDENQKEMLLYYLMSISLAKFDYKQALEQCNIITDSKNINLFTLSALFYTPYCERKLGNKEGSMIGYNRVLNFLAKCASIDSENFPVILFLLMCLYELEKYDLALFIIILLQKTAMDNPELIMLRSIVERANGDNECADADEIAAADAGSFIAALLKTEKFNTYTVNIDRAE